MIRVAAVLVGLAAVLSAAATQSTDDKVRQVVGVLEEVDFIHRTGRFRAGAAGGCIAFELTPEAQVEYLNADADLRDLPLGVAYQFTLRRDAEGRFTQAAAVRDQFSADARAGILYRMIVADPAAGTLRVSPVRSNVISQEPSVELRTGPRTAIWKGDKKIALAAIGTGDEILANRGGADGTACVAIWVGRDTQAAATDRQRQRYAAFVKARGLPARVERAEGRRLTLSVFGGEPAISEHTWPGDSSRPGRGVRVVVANGELRTWNPPVDHEFSKIVEFRKDPAGREVRLVVEVNHMLEGFRRGRYVRVFSDPWRLQDQPFGEQLFHYGARHFPPELAECPAKEYPEQHPFRTDYGNIHLPWYRLRPGVTPPPGSEHRVFGDLVAVGGDHRSGRFRLDNSAEEVEFSLIPGATARFLNSAGDLADAPVGTRCRFDLYLDDTGAFRRASFVTDEASDLVHNGAVWRVESLNRDDGMLTVARQPPGVRNDQGDPEQPPDIGRALLRISPETHVWKGDRPADLGGLAVGDLCLVNRTGERPGRPSRCSDIWVGANPQRPLPSPRPRKLAPPSPKGTPP